MYFLKQSNLNYQFYVYMCLFKKIGKNKTQIDLEIHCLGRSLKKSFTNVFCPSLKIL